MKFLTGFMVAVTLCVLAFIIVLLVNDTNHQSDCRDRGGIYSRNVCWDKSAVIKEYR